MACFLQGIAQSNASWRDWDYEKQARHLVLAMFSTYRTGICNCNAVCFSSKTRYTFTVMTEQGRGRDIQKKYDLFKGSCYCLGWIVLIIIIYAILIQ